MKTTKLVIQEMQQLFNNNPSNVTLGADIGYLKLDNSLREEMINKYFKNENHGK